MSILLFQKEVKNIMMNLLRTEKLGHVPLGAGKSVLGLREVDAKVKTLA